MIVQNLPRASNPNRIQDIDCFLCRKLGKELKTIYSCLQCKKGFHVNCFTAFHYCGALSTSRRAVLQVVVDSATHPTVGQPSKFVPQPLNELQLPVDRDMMFPRANIRIKANANVNKRRRIEIKEQRCQHATEQLSRSAGHDNSNSSSDDDSDYNSAVSH